MTRTPNTESGDAVWPLAVVGAGAAGLTAAIFAGRAGAQTLLLETRPAPGAKIRASGGGRCNVLPSAVALEDFHTSGSIHALRNILFSWPLDEVREFFTRDLGVPLKREPTGKLFPVDDDPRGVVQALLDACARAGVKLWGEYRVTEIRRLEAGAAGARFEVVSEGGARALCRRLILATGGQSLPKTGSDGGGYALARALGHAVVPPYPALVPLVSGDRRWSELAGISAQARVRAERGGRILEEREGSLLVTHRGFSGPVILDMSRHVTAPGGGGTRLLVRWGGAREPDWELGGAGGRREIGPLLSERLPRRLAALLLEIAGVPFERRLAELSRQERASALDALAAYPLPVAGNEGYRTAEVTGGGVALAEISPRTLESRIAPGLHFAGEMLDGTGRVGGFNFLWAWVTGRRAGEAAAGRD